MDKPLILICDDEQDLWETYQHILADTYTLFFAADGMCALEEIRTREIAVIVLDIKLPGMDGLSVLKEALALRPQVKVLLASGYQSAEIVQEATRLGAYDYLPKPFDSAALKGALEGALKA